MYNVNVKVLIGDCLKEMPRIADQSVNLILTDLPYGITKNAWDGVIPLEPLWKHYRRIIHPRGVLAFTVCQPFASLMLLSCPEWFRYEDVWDKRNAVGHLNAKIMPLRRHELIQIYAPCSITNMVYNPQMRKGKFRQKGTNRYVEAGSYGAHNDKAKFNDDYYPTSIIEIHNSNRGEKIHKTQKPVALFEYLIRTYSYEGDTVLDNAMGSGTTGVACIRSNRNFIGIEIDREMAEKAMLRFHQAETEE